ncbi:hypothetical protein IGI04_036640 [Brassica rapa subsp. trilocularis]|uniref:Uncharacterized protein n=1 Tax=Brassica rapa subsp. trilocularis TaxID=1813537 RepID=A0ABQ7LF07_BRACM|nr:hypothetical protein IGI04_036640 [Brassica rapa subsp. trilocularis]
MMIPTTKHDWIEPKHDDNIPNHDGRKLNHDCRNLDLDRIKIGKYTPLRRACLDASRGLFVQYTQHVCGCPSAHTGRLCVSVSTHRTPVAVRVCPSAHTGRLWQSISTHIRMLVLGLSTLTLLVDCSGDFGLLGLSVQYTQDVRGCPPAHTGRPWLSVCVHLCRSEHTERPWLSISTHISTLVLRFSTLALPVECSCDFGPRGLSVQYTHDVRGCPPAHTGRPWVSTSTHRTSVAVCGCPSAHTESLWLSVCVRVCPSAYTGPHTGRPWLSICTHISTLVLGLSTLTLPVDCLGDFGPRGLSVQYTQDIRGCPPAHTGPHTGLPWLSISTHIRTLVLGLSTLALPMDCLGRPWLSVCVRVCQCGSVSTHRTSVGVRQYTQDIRVCLSSHTGCLWLSVCVRVCPSAHTARPWLSTSTHISTLVLGLSTLALPMEFLGDFGLLALSVQYAQDVRGCPPAHTGHPWLSISTNRTSVAVRVCPCVSVSTHRTSVGVRQYTQDVRVCLSAHTGCPWLSVCVRQHTQHVRGCPQVHISARWPFPWTVWVILAYMGCLFSTHRTSVRVRQHTQDVRGCPWLSVSTHRTSVAVRVCLCVSVSTHRTSVAVHQYTYQHAGPWTQHAGPCGLSVQYTQDVCGCRSAHTRRLWVSVSAHRTSVAVRVCPCVSVNTQDVCGCPSYTHDVRGCPSANTGRLCVSISTHISTLVLGLSTLALLVDCLDDFGPRGLSVQYAQDVWGCPPAHTGRPWLSVAVRQHTHDVCGCPCVSVGVLQHAQDVRGCLSAHTGCPWPSVCVRVCPSAHTGRPWLSISTHISTLVLGISTLAFPVDCLDIRGYLSLSVSTHRTSMAVHQYTYQHVGPWTEHANPSRGLFG